MSKKGYYTDGNTVRRAEPVRRERQKSREELERIRRKKLRRNAARRNREKAMYMSRGNVAFLSICIAMIAIAASGYVYFQSQITHKAREISALESRINDLKADNDARYKNVSNSVDLEQVKQTAMKELGMDYPRQEQIIYYSVDKTNFMDQYQDIPVQ